MAWNFILYLLYGLAFFTLGVAVLSRDTRQSELGIAKILWLLAFFGILHGFHEWLELLEQLHLGSVSPAFSLFRLVLVSVSFLFLLYFGIFLNIITIFGEDALTTTPNYAKAGVGILALVLMYYAVANGHSSGNDINIRRMIAFPGGLLSGIGLIIYSRSVRGFSIKVAANFIFAGAAMVGYSFFTGIIPSDFVVPILNIQIIILRGGCAVLIMLFTIKALYVFSLEQKELINEQLQRFAQSEKLTSMGILAAGIAHEINNPLTNVSLNIEMLKDLVGGDEKVDKKLESIDRNIVRASSIANELLHFAREEETSLEAVNLNDVINSSMNLLRNQELSSIITLKLNSIKEVLGIPYKLEEVIINVLMNSLDACREEDLIEVETSQNIENVMVVITDTGKGISQDMIARVFDPFFTTKEIGKGTGLGLSVCYNIVNQHGGDISLMSSENGGTVVTIKLPLVRMHE